MPPDILLYALVFAGLVFWLRNILGTRHGEERDRANPFASGANESSETSKQADHHFGIEDAAGNMRLSSEDNLADSLPKNMRIDNKTAENALLDIIKTDKTFDFLHFAGGVQDAFAMIVESFADGDRETLKSLLSDSVYNAFDQAIKERDDRGETVTTEILAIRHADITNAVMRDKMAFITVRFTADETCVIRDKEGEIISGDPERTTEMTDLWTFGRSLKSKDPAWLLYETRDGEVEDHKTPVPDAS